LRFFEKLRLAVSVESIEGKGILGSESTGTMLTRVKSALLAAIFGVTGGVALLLAVPAPAFKIHPAKFAPDYGESMVPQIEDEEEAVGVPEPSYHYSQPLHAKTEKPVPRRNRHVARLRPNLFERLVAGFLNLQKHQPAKSCRRWSHTTSRRG
jgi:hypothetical protein